MNILIIEDDEAIQSFLAKVIQDNYPTWKTELCSTYDQSLVMATNNTYDIFIIDYELDRNNPDKNGINLGIAISDLTKYRNTPIIFETVYTEHVFNAVNKLNCFYYLTKPYNSDDVLDMLKKLELKIHSKQTISVSDQCGISAYIDLDDIIMVQANHHKLTIIMPSTTFICTSHSLDSLAKLSEGLLVRSHKSFLVNKNYISQIDKRALCVYVKHPSCDTVHKAKIGRAYHDFMK